MKKLDLTNRKYGMLTVLCELHNIKRTSWLCLCDCGCLTEVSTSHIRSGHTKSCGCVNRKYIKYPRRLLQCYRDMYHRCYSGKHINKEHYEKKGIKICEEWLNDKKSFFDWAMNNGYADNLTIDRINVNGNYEPNNCRWASAETQMNNTTRNHYITIGDTTKTIAQWSKQTGVSPSCIEQRIRVLGWSAEKAVFTPTKNLCYNK